MVGAHEPAPRASSGDLRGQILERKGPAAVAPVQEGESQHAPLSNGRG